ncbi:uncharacterized protein [Cicer arietinum]|uniref:uncharacterized protein isoform X1 n=1 Tax=Cicer arietinum TaxID=3827 RepID=UPI003CC64E76
MMGSTMKKSIFDEQTSKAIKKWHATAKKNYRLKLGKSSVRAMDRSPTDSTVHSTTPTLLRFKTTSPSTPSLFHPTMTNIRGWKAEISSYRYKLANDIIRRITRSMNRDIYQRMLRLIDARRYEDGRRGRRRYRLIDTS